MMAKAWKSLPISLLLSLVILYTFFHWATMDSQREAWDEMLEQFDGLGARIRSTTEHELFSWEIVKSRLQLYHDELDLFTQRLHLGTVVLSSLTERLQQRAETASGQPSDRAAGMETTPTWEERFSAAHRQWTEWEQDPQRCELFARFRHAVDWQAIQFLSDPSLNPSSRGLNEQEQREFEDRLALAKFRLQSFEDQIQLAVLRALEVKLTGVWAALESGRDPFPPTRHDDEVLRTVTFSGGQQLVVTAQDVPALPVLRLERDVTICQWLTESEQFIAGQ